MEADQKHVVCWSHPGNPEGVTIETVASQGEALERAEDLELMLGKRIECIAVCTPEFHNEWFTPWGHGRDQWQDEAA